MWLEPWLAVYSSDTVWPAHRRSAVSFFARFFCTFFLKHRSIRLKFTFYKLQYTIVLFLFVCLRTPCKLPCSVCPAAATYWPHSYCPLILASLLVVPLLVVPLQLTGSYWLRSCCPDNSDCWANMTEVMCIESLIYCLKYKYICLLCFSISFADKLVFLQYLRFLIPTK